MSAKCIEPVEQIHNRQDPDHLLQQGDEGLEQRATTDIWRPPQSATATAMLALGLKKSTKAVDIVKPVQAKIKETLSDEDADEAEGPLQELQTLRDSARGVGDGGGKAGRDKLVKYWQALETLHSRVPISEEGVQIPFTWSDAHYARKTAKQMNATFERASIMLNYAALLSQEAKATDQGNSDGLKEAYNLLSQAVGVLDHIRDNVAGSLSVLKNFSATKSSTFGWFSVLS